MTSATEPLTTMAVASSMPIAEYADRFSSSWSYSAKRLALGEMLIDGDALEEAEAAFVAFVADSKLLKTPPRASNRPGCGAGAGAAMTPPALEDVEHEREGLGVFVAIDEAPLPAAVEPDAVASLSVSRTPCFRRRPVFAGRAWSLSCAGLLESFGDWVAIR